MARWNGLTKIWKPPYSVLLPITRPLGACTYLGPSMPTILSPAPPLACPPSRPPWHTSAYSSLLTKRTLPCSQSKPIYISAARCGKRPGQPSSALTATGTWQTTEGPRLLTISPRNSLPGTLAHLKSRSSSTLPLSTSNCPSRYTATPPSTCSNSNPLPPVHFSLWPKLLHQPRL